ncbi:uncharacterized protein P174DRAFT_454055 [Aspergillus novofumigatus IBT 16806]|uniref:Uncharacterized protein n=1 Tax=Aspergillus novofumigatus (strain IBT 16806) TaxID=1392255 RepID=A0A2I1C0W4_ASPN1|nr:uncharacterized protein P174DRAFT_454055 [Aspergillus novofumigatus IBT 16806]PKX91221.1 hypothetical protein P174DRAFT_454055 [Aspergillus novofumigatus IBT 16806]
MTPLVSVVYKVSDAGIAGTKKHVNTGSPNRGLDDYAEYAFIVRERVDRNSNAVMTYVDIKSEGLREILRAVLQDVKAISLMEDKPSVSFPPRARQMCGEHG